MFAASALVTTITAVQPDPGPMVSVVTAARPVAAGATLAEGDLRVVDIPAHLVPDEVLTRPEDALGLVVPAPLSARSILTRATVASGQALAQPGMVVVALPVADDAVAALLRPGTRIDLFAATSTGAGVLASEVRVVTAPPAAAGGLGNLTPRNVVLIEVTPEVAAKVAATGGQGGITVAVR